MLYSLTIYNEMNEGFFIGLFKSYEKARQIAQNYLSTVSGFRDYPCIYEITEKQVIGTINNSMKVHVIWGWNEDREGHNIDIWCSDCYANLKDAEQIMADAKKNFKKQEWSLDTYLIEQCYWTDGFVRIFY